MARRSPRTSSGHTILVVDDQEDTLLSVRSLLVREGHRVLLAESGDVRCTVTDRAGGIPPDVLPRIFEELYTTKEPGRGTGLGLWIARQLVEETFGGTLTVVSAPGAETRFTIAMPASRLADANARPAA